MAFDRCILKFLLRIVDGKHLMRFQNESSFFLNFSGLVQTENILCVFRVKAPYQNHFSQSDMVLRM